MDTKQQPLTAATIKFGTVSDNALTASAATASPASGSCSKDVVLPARTQSAPPNHIEHLAPVDLAVSTSDAKSPITTSITAIPHNTISTAITTPTATSTASTISTASTATPSTMLSAKKPLPVNAAPYQPSFLTPPPPHPYGAYMPPPYYGAYRGKAMPPPQASYDPALQYAASLMRSKGVGHLPPSSSLSASVAPLVSTAVGTRDEEAAKRASPPVFAPPPSSKPVRIQNPLTGEVVKIATPNVPKLASPSTAPTIISSSSTTAPISPTAPNVAVPSSTFPAPTASPPLPEQPSPTLPTIVKKATTVTIKDPSSGKPVELVSHPKAIGHEEDVSVKELERLKGDGESPQQLHESLAKLDISIDKAEDDRSIIDVVEDDRKAIDNQDDDGREAPQLPVSEYESGDDVVELEEEVIDLSGLIRPGMKITYPSRFVPFDVPTDGKGVWRYTRRFLLQFMTICTQRPDKAAEMARIAAVQHQHRQQQSSRGGHSRRQAPRKVYSEAEKQAYLSQLTRAENAWVPVVNSQDLQENERIIRLVTGILNKLTMENFGPLFEELQRLSLHDQPESVVNQIIEIVFDKATTETKYAELYALLCQRLALHEVERLSAAPRTSSTSPSASYSTTTATPISSLQGSRFRSLLVNHVQAEYNRKREWSEERLRLAAQGIHVKSLASGNLTDSDLTMIKRKRRVLGNMRFIGELYKQKLISPKIMHEILLEMLGTAATSEPEEDEVECVCRLFSTVAPSLWELTHLLTEPTLKRDFLAHFALYRQRLTALARAAGKVSNRVRFMIMDTLEQFERRTQTLHMSPVMSQTGSTAGQATQAHHHQTGPVSPMSQTSQSPGPVNDSSHGNRSTMKPRRASRDSPLPSSSPSVSTAQNTGNPTRQPAPQTQVAWQPSATAASPSPKEDEQWTTTTATATLSGKKPNASVPSATTASSVSSGRKSPPATTTAAAVKTFSTRASAALRASSPVVTATLPVAPSPPMSSNPTLEKSASSTSLNRFDALESAIDVDDVPPYATTEGVEQDKGEEGGEVAHTEVGYKYDDEEDKGEVCKDTMDRDVEQEAKIDKFLANYGGEYFNLRSVAELAYYAEGIRDWSRLLHKWLAICLDRHSSVKQFEELFVPACNGILIPHLQDVPESDIRSLLMRADDWHCDYPLVYDYLAIFLVRCHLPCLSKRSDALKSDNFNTIKSDAPMQISGRFVKDHLLSTEEPMTSGRLLSHVLKHDAALLIDMTTVPVDYFKQAIRDFERQGVLGRFPRLAAWYVDQQLFHLKGQLSMNVEQVCEAVRKLILSVPPNIIREANLLGDLCRLLFGVYCRQFNLRLATPRQQLHQQGPPMIMKGEEKMRSEVAAALLRDEWLPTFLVVLSPIVSTEDMRPEDWRAVVQAARRAEDEDSAFGGLLLDGLRHLGIIPGQFFDDPSTSMSANVVMLSSLPSKCPR